MKKQQSNKNNIIARAFSEIGVLTANKVSSRQYKIVAPLNPEKPIKYVRKPIDYGILDEVGHGIHTTASAQKLKHRGSSQGSIQSLSTNPSTVGPPPQTKPPTPPMGRNTGTIGKAAGNTGTLGKSSMSNTGTLGKSSREYRTPPVVIPPQVPSHYAPGHYPTNTIRRPGSTSSATAERGPGYGPLPMPPSQVAMHHTSISSNNQPQINMVHPMQTLHTPTSTYEERNSNMPPPPSPLTITHEMPDHGHIGMHTLSRNAPR
jgi:abl interactor 2